MRDTASLSDRSAGVSFIDSADSASSHNQRLALPSRPGGSASTKSTRPHYRWCPTWRAVVAADSVYCPLCDLLAADKTHPGAGLTPCAEVEHGGPLAPPRREA